MIRSQSCVDESRDFFPAEDRRKAKLFFRIVRLGDAPGFLESFAVEKEMLQLLDILRMSLELNYVMYLTVSMRLTILAATRIGSG